MRVTRTKVLLAGIFLLAIFLRFFGIGQDGFGNLYYAATVQSALTNWHNLFFVSFDPNGFVSVDKPPLGFWIQALSASIFGFHGWALILPQALAGSLSTLVLYRIVQRTFGETAGLLAALILAVTPISVATARNNTPDSLLTLVVLLAAWAALKAAESGQLRWLLASAALVGIGFNIKMLQAYLVAPALFLFLPPPHGLLKRMGQLTLAMLVMFSISFTWPLVVDGTPADQRPYVGSTSTNSEMELVAVHNGARRLGKILVLFGIREKGPAPVATPPPAPAQMTFPPPSADSIRPWPDGGATEVGEAGLLRLFTPPMAGQVSWLLPLSLLALVSGIVRTSWKLPLGRQALFYSMWAGWLVPAFFFFSFGGLLHRYYLDMLAPPVAALSAVGLTQWTADLIGRKPTGRLLYISILFTIALTVFFLGYYPGAGWLLIPLGLLGLLTLPSLLLPISNPSVPLPVRAAVVLSALLLVPFYWSLTPILYGGDVTLPYAGPDLRYWGGQRDHMSKYEWVAGFLQAQPQDETFLAATDNAVVASPLQLLTKRPVMALGGFTGADPILTVDELTQLAVDGDVRFFLLEPHEPGQSKYADWAFAHCARIPGITLPNNLEFYDCHPRR